MMPYSMKFEKKAKIKITFQKMKGNFLDSISWLKSHQLPLVSKVQNMPNQTAPAIYGLLSLKSGLPHPAAQITTEGLCL